MEQILTAIAEVVAANNAKSDRQVALYLGGVDERNPLNCWRLSLDSNGKLVFEDFAREPDEPEHLRIDYVRQDGTERRADTAGIAAHTVNIWYVFADTSDLEAGRVEVVRKVWGECKQYTLDLFAGLRSHRPPYAVEGNIGYEAAYRFSSNWTGLQAAVVLIGEE